MNKQIAHIEPIPLPDPRRPGTIPSLPAWLERCNVAAKLELQLMPETGSYGEVMTLPAELMPSREQYRAMNEHIDSLLLYLDQTPAKGEEYESKTASAITSMLLVLPSSRKSDLGTEARADVYLDVLDDTPWWAIKAAVRKWHRHECGKDERGQEYDYRWAPDPGTLRRVAYGETWEIRQRIRDLAKVLQAREYVDCSAELAKGRAAMQGLNIHLKSGSSDKPLTFGDAIRLAGGTVPQ